LSAQEILPPQRRPRSSLGMFVLRWILAAVLVGLLVSLLLMRF
jgi:hypothetical protein